ncbi:MAG: hypothetical protein IPP57_17615 [Candidatus Obscuribacter sp.]|nr:hypothetical protein [Candidatus Obscuribacter sp.]MBK9772604.1 hypothetical protein [Candidatus Obscuribacter sp.]
MTAQSNKSFVLDNLSIASPCPKLWSEMELTDADAVRFCGDCKKNVYDVSQMTTAETELLVQRASAAEAAGQGRSLCMQLYRRADGTVITDDCPVGLRRLRDSWRKVRNAAAAAIALVLTQAGVSFADSKEPCKTTPGTTAKSGSTSGASSSSSSSSSQGAERGEANVQNRPVIPRTGGMVAPSFEWNMEAAKVPEIKVILDKLMAMQSKPKQSKAERIEQAKLQFEVAKLGAKKNMARFAQDHYLSAQNLAEMYDDQKPLLKKILLERQKNDEKLGGYARQDIEKKLKEIGE